jgi:SAM-dependent methyltransferase
MGSFAAARKLIAYAFRFFGESLPDRRRQRFGDIDYDWEHRVDTTSANVSWRSRFLGLLNSPYQPIEPALFREMMATLAIDFKQFTFIDIGSGKGRALLLASDYPFQRILGIELLRELHLIAQRNVSKISSLSSRRPPIEIICEDATRFDFPEAPLVVFLNNPLPESALRKVTYNIENSLREKPRSVFVLYANPILEQVMSALRRFQKITGTHQFAIFQSEG